MPLLAILLSVFGLVPFVICGLGALSPNAATAARMLQALVGYGAVILAFAGGVHWGSELQSPATDKFIQRARLGIPVIAVLTAWVAVIVPLVVAPWVSLLVLIAAYVGAVLVEQEAGRRNLLPPRYLWVRWAFTVVAVAMLVTVLTLRLLGQTTNI